MKKAVVLLCACLFSLSLACGGGGDGTGGGGEPPSGGFANTRYLADISSELGELMVYSSCPDGAGGRWISGYYKGVIGWGSGSSSGSEGEAGMFVARLDSTGAILHFETLAGVGAFEGSNICPDGAGGCWVSGAFNDELTLGGVTMEPYGPVDFFVARFSPSYSWSDATHLGNSAGSILMACSLRSDGAGGCWLSGRFDGTVKFGDDATLNTTADASYSPFLAHYDAADGWSRATAFLPVDGVTSAGVCVDAFQAGDDETWSLVLFSGSVTVPGGGDIYASSGGDMDLVLVRFNRYGDAAVVFHPGLGTVWNTAGFFPFKLVSDGAGGVVAAGTFTGTANLGGHTVTCPPTADFSLFLFRYNNTLGGPIIFAVSIDGARPDALAMDDDGDFWVGGVLGGPAGIGDYSYTGSGGVFAAHLNRLDHTWDLVTASGGYFADPFGQLRLPVLYPVAPDDAVAMGAFNTYSIYLGETLLAPAGGVRWASFYCDVDVP